MALYIGGVAVDATAAEIDVLDGLDRGSIIYGNASSVTSILDQGTANQVLTSDGDDISWQSSSAAAITSIAGTAANQILTDDGDATVTSEANLTYDGTHSALSNTDSSLTLVGGGAAGDVEWVGIKSEVTKTAGDSDDNDDFYGLRAYADFNDEETFGYLCGADIRSKTIDTGARVGAANQRGMIVRSQMVGADVDIGNMIGMWLETNIDEGIVRSTVHGLYINVDHESAADIASSVFGIHLQMIDDSSTAHTTYGINGYYGSAVDWTYMVESGAGETIKFTPAGDGYWDGAADNGAADYAEYFESNGGVIPTGNTVTLVDGKIKQAEEGDSILGVIRPHDGCALIGNSSWSKWQNKFLTGAYGEKIMESFTKTKWTAEVDEAEYRAQKSQEGAVKYSEAEGKYYRDHKYHSDRIPDDLTVPDDAEIITHPKFIRRKLNPDYDESLEYVPREDRDEWHIVGLLGQIPITKGQPVADNWIKMKDISDTVEMWFVK